MKELDLYIGEGFEGPGVNAAHINVLETGQVVALSARCDQIADTLRTANRRGGGGHLGPWVIARGGVA